MVGAGRAPESAAPGRDSIAADNARKEQEEIALAERLKSEREENARLEKERQAQAMKDAEAAKLKAARDAEQKRLADIQAQKAALEKSNPQKKNNNDVSAYRFDFDKQFIPDGIREETITEPNRTIIRTIVKAKEEAATYLKITYNYGGVFYFKNSQSITENTYGLELSNFRKQLDQN